LLLAYALATPLKWAELLPSHMTWLGIAVMPGALFAALGALFAFPLWFRQWWWIGFLPFAVLCGATMLALLCFERGW
jgi:hypothetical protein